MTAFGLFSEPLGLRYWQATLDSLSLPLIARSIPKNLVFFTPMVPVFSQALVWSSRHTRLVCWHGILPGSCQSIFRAELLAVSGRVGRLFIYTDSLSVLSYCKQDHATAASGDAPMLPADNKDLCAFFLSMACGVDLDDSQIRWIKGHVNCKIVSGIDKIHPWFNHWVDLAAKEGLKGLPHCMSIWLTSVVDLWSWLKICTPFRQVLLCFLPMTMMRQRCILLFISDPCALSVCIPGLRSMLISIQWFVTKALHSH